MKRLGYLLIALGFLVGALTTVVQETGVVWSYFTLGLGVGVAGIVLVRLGERQRVQARSADVGGLADLTVTLDRITTNLQQLNAEKTSLDPYAIHTHIDDAFRSDLTRFMAEREQITHTYGLQAYADVMSPLAAGERYLNRAWSASTDGYVDEVHTYLDRAAVQFVEARDQLAQLQA